MDNLDPQPGRPSVKVRLAMPRQSQLFFLALLGLMVFLTWTVFRPFLIYMVAGTFVAVLALPVDRFWEKFFPNRIAAFCTIFTLFALITIPLAILGVFLYQDVSEVAREVDEGTLHDWTNQTLEVVSPFLPAQTAEERNETIREIVDQAEVRAEAALRTLARELLQALPDFFVGLVVILFVVYYILTDGERLVGYLRRATPLPARQVDFLLSEAGRGLRAVFVGQILTSVIQGAVGGIMFVILGVPGAILWTLVMMLFSLLPVVGAFLVWIPAAIYLMVADSLWKGFVMLGWGALVVSQVDNFVRPKLIGDRADIHPLFVLIGVLGGVAAFGFIGLFLGPLLVGVTISVLKVWERDYLDPEVDRYGEEPGVAG
jgi:predicted PurR-regulated permease PerM